MNKTDFKYEDLEKYIEKAYVYDNKNYLLVIDEKIFEEETIQFAENVIKRWLNYKDEIIEYMLDLRLRKWYKDYTDEYIKTNIGRPKITIDSKNDGTKMWNYKYSGIIDFLEHNLDNHIISIEFFDELKLDDNVQMNG